MSCPYIFGLIISGFSAIHNKFESFFLINKFKSFKCINITIQGLNVKCFCTYY